MERLRIALTPSAETKAAYIGEVSFTVPDIDADGAECSRTVTVPWATMALILTHATKEQP